MPPTPPPSYLFTPSTSRIDPPVETLADTLPFDKLSWQNFERLCMRLALEAGHVESCRPYGVQGDEQHGIDLYGKHKGENLYTVYQCKNVADFGPAKIHSAVDEFMQGEWKARSGRMVLCLRDSISTAAREEAIWKQTERLGAESIQLETWDQTGLNKKLKDYPTVVHDFFGRAWVEKFNGPAALGLLVKRLDVADVLRYRSELGAFYRRIFQKQDPGPPSPDDVRENKWLEIHARFVVPDLWESRAAEQSIKNEIDARADENEHFSPQDRSALLPDVQSVETYTRHNAKRKIRARSSVERFPVEKYLGVHNRVIILGKPGSGKSALLRFVASDLLSDCPKLEELARSWGSYLPVWIPFGYWTQLIGDTADRKPSVYEFLEGWFKTHSESALWPLVQKALEDQRLLLLVDGLDEWKNEEAARVALDLLVTFIEQRCIAAVLTSRPHGFARLRMVTAGWRIANMAGFTPQQQGSFARTWFSFWGRSESEQDAQLLLDELGDAPSLEDLAEVPLLLTLLVRRFLRAPLPPNRFTAYRDFIDDLIDAHPSRRRQAALQAKPGDAEWTTDEQWIVLGHLAYEMHMAGQRAAFPVERAKKVLADLLADPGGQFGWLRDRARRMAVNYVGGTDDSIGLLVRVSPEAVGFFHPALREYLTAFHVSNLSIAEQKDIISKNINDPSWREVILCLLHISSTGNTSELADLLVSIMHGAKNPILRINCEEMLVAVSVGASKIPAKFATKFTEQAISYIEEGAWMPHRKRLLYQTESGIDNSKTDELVKNKLRNWLPCRIPWRRRIFFEMSQWPKDDRTLKCLYQGIHDEELPNKRAAALTLAGLAKGDNHYLNKISQLITEPYDKYTTAAALESLINGWPDDCRTKKLYACALSSSSPEVWLMGAAESVRQCHFDRMLLDNLISVSLPSAPITREYKDTISDALASSWPLPEKEHIKNVCLESLMCFRDPERSRRDHIDVDIAIQTLLKGYPQDTQVATECAVNLSTIRFPFLLKDRAGELLVEHFYGHPALVPFLDKWIEIKGRFGGPDLYRAALASRSEQAKRLLLGLLGTGFVHWPAAALLDGWGLQDEEIQRQLQGMARGESAVHIGHLLPRILTSPTECRERLLVLLRDPECPRPDFVISGLYSLGVQRPDDEVIDLGVRLAEKRSESIWAQSGLSTLLVGWNYDSRVRALALQELSVEDGDITAVAKGFGYDEGLRSLIMEQMTPLPAELRLASVEHLGRMRRHRSFVAGILADYRSEPDPEVRTLASFEHHRLSPLAEKSTHIERLKSDLVAYGPAMEARRQAAWAGIAALDGISIGADLTETIGNASPSMIPLQKFGETNRPFCRIVVKNWANFSKYVGLGRLTQYVTEQELKNIKLGTLEYLAIEADAEEEARDAILSMCEHAPDTYLYPGLLEFVARQRPRSALLRDLLLRIFEQTYQADRVDFELGQAAVRLVMEHFSRESEFYERLIARRSSLELSDLTVTALCRGWRASDKLGECYIGKTHPRWQRLQVVAELISARSTSEETLKFIIAEMSEYPQRYRAQLIFPAFMHRLRWDETLADLMMAGLRVCPTSFQRVSWVRLLATTRGLSKPLQDYCEQELNRLYQASELTEFGFDVVADDVRPISQVYMDVLSGNIEH